jgi:hypothetical protein
MTNFSPIKKISIARMMALIGLPLMMGCSSYYAESVSPTSGPGAQDAHLNVSMSISQVGALAKTAKISTISLSKLIISLASSQNDQIQDTLTPTTNPPLNPDASQPQTYSMSFALRPNVTWKAVVWTVDTRDSIVHMDSITISALESGQTKSVSWNLAPKFTMYDAQFMIPDSISFSGSNAPAQALSIDRLVLIVDGVVRADSTAANPGPYFTPNATAILPFDYVTTGQHSIQLLAYGPFASWNQASPLFSGSATVNVQAGQDSSLAIQLNWVGPGGSTGVPSNIGVVIGRVGTITDNVSGSVSLVP